MQGFNEKYNNSTIQMVPVLLNLKISEYWRLSLRYCSRSHRKHFTHIILSLSYLFKNNKNERMILTETIWTGTPEAPCRAKPGQIFGHEKMWVLSHFSRAGPCKALLKERKCVKILNTWIVLSAVSNKIGWRKFNWPCLVMHWTESHKFPTTKIKWSPYLPA